MRTSQIIAVMNADEMPGAAEIHAKYSHLSRETVQEAHRAGAEIRKNRKASKAVQQELF
jgi:uncharacterized protein (DUF433 family)